MTTATIRVEGARELRLKLKEMADVGLTRQLSAANKTASMVVVERALPNVPVRTGRLRSSVRALGSQAQGQVRAGSASVDYAAAIHWGRKIGNVWGGRMAPNPIVGRPFLWDAAQAALPQVIDTYEHAIDLLLDQL